MSRKKKETMTSLVGGVAQAFHDDRDVELRAQLGKQEVEGKNKEEQVKVGEVSQRRCAHGWCGNGDDKTQNLSQ